MNFLVLSPSGGKKNLVRFVGSVPSHGQCPPPRAVRRYIKIDVEYDLYEDDELVLSDIAEVNPKLFSEDFRRSVIRKMEHILLDMIEKRGPLAQTELPPAVLERLEKKLTTGVDELSGPGEDAPQGAAE